MRSSKTEADLELRQFLAPYLGLTKLLRQPSTSPKTQPRHVRNGLCYNYNCKGIYEDPISSIAVILFRSPYWCADWT